MKQTKYNPGYRSKRYAIRYEGLAGTFHCFRVSTRDHTAMDALSIRNAISEWTNHKAKGKTFLGNSFEANPAVPNVPFANDGLKDIFVLFDRIEDIVGFERRFPVLGFSPTMTV